MENFALLNRIPPQLRVLLWVQGANHHLLEVRAKQAGSDHGAGRAAAGFFRLAG